MKWFPSVWYSSPTCSPEKMMIPHYNITKAEGLWRHSNTLTVKVKVCPNQINAVSHRTTINLAQKQFTCVPEHLNTKTGMVVGLNTGAEA